MPGVWFTAGEVLVIREHPCMHPFLPKDTVVVMERRESCVLATCPIRRTLRADGTGISSQAMKITVFL